MDFKTNDDFKNAMEINEFSLSEINIGVEILSYIRLQGEIGATAAQLRNKYEDKIFVQKVLNILRDLKLVMRTGVCEMTFVHWKHIKPWIVNTYHLKRLERVSNKSKFFESTLFKLFISSLRKQLSR